MELKSWPIEAGRVGNLPVLKRADFRFEVGDRVFTSYGRAMAYADAMHRENNRARDTTG